jgi:hypothetical protein
MNVTEDEARKRWCPMTRVAFLGSHVGNRVSSAMLKMCEKSSAQGDRRDLDYVLQQVADTLCIASACMFWKFTGYRQVPNGNDEAHGTCGLAPDLPDPPPVRKFVA